MGITGAERAIIYDNATQDYVEVRLIQPDSVFNMEGIGEEDIDGNMNWVEDRAYLNLAFFDDADIAQLKTWQRGRTKLRVTVIGVQDYIFWDRDATILVIEPNDFAPRGRNVTRVVMRARGDNLPINRELPIELVDSEGTELQGFIGKNEQQDRIEAHNLFPADFGAEDTFSWTIDGQTYEFGTVIFNTLN